DLAAVMLRERPFPDGADARTLEAAFRAAFPQRDDDYEKMFVFVDEQPDRLFQAEAPPDGYEGAIKQALNEIDAKAGPLALPLAADSELGDDDPVLLQVQQILSLGTSGIILSGAPGTGKSYYAKRLSRHLTVDPDQDVYRVQFHPSY